MRIIALIAAISCSCTEPNPGTECAGDVCLPEGCGNGLVEPAFGEICDDGNRTSRDGCSADCRSRETCGDGVADPEVSETCDCGDDASSLPLGCNGVNSIAPDASCRPDCKPGRCGDGTLDSHEFCDDGNTEPGDGCRADCTGRWTKVTSNTLQNLEDVSATSATDAWAVGGQRILRWNGTAWSPVTVPPLLDNRKFRRVYTPAIDEVFIVGEAAGGALAVFHLIGGTWTNVTPTSLTWLTVHGRGNDIYLCGENGSAPSDRAHIAHWNGNAFVDPGPFGENELPWTVAVLQDGTAFAATNPSPPTVGHVYRKLVGGSWTQLGPVTSGNFVATSTTELFAFSRTGVSVYSATAGDSVTTIAGATELGTKGTAASAVSGTAIIVGASGQALICTATGCDVSDTGTSRNLLGVDVVDDKHAFIVGDTGTILY